MQFISSNDISFNCVQPFHNRTTFVQKVDTYWVRVPAVETIDIINEVTSTTVIINLDYLINPFVNIICCVVVKYQNYLILLRKLPK